MRAPRLAVVADENLFLRHLGAADRETLRPSLNRLILRQRDIIAWEGAAIETVFLPIDCIVSVIAVMREGRQVESRTIGRESGFGLLHALGSAYSYERVDVQVGGAAWSLPLRALSDLAKVSPHALKVIACFAQASAIQSSVSVACNALHTAEQRYCRSLLLTQDRLQSDIVPLTQEHLAIMLGVQRSTVAALAGRAQELGLIRRCARGKIEIRDRAGLLAASCECYEQIEDGVRRLLGES